MTELLLDGLGFPESARWHDDRLWLANWGTGQVLAVDSSGTSEVIVTVATSIPFSIDWLPDGRLVIVSGQEAALLTLEPDGSLSRYADLSGIGSVFNEIVVDAQGNAFVNGSRTDPTAGPDPSAGIVAVVRPDSSISELAEGIAFGNGMAITPDGSTLIVAESHGRRLTAFDIAADATLSGRRVWADLGTGTPDGICLDVDGAVWYADVPNRQCARVREGGEVLDTVAVDRGCFACMLGGPDGATLFVLAAQWRGFEHMHEPGTSGRVYTAAAPARHAGRP